MAPAGAGFEGRERLKTGAQYRKVFDGGTRVEGSLFLLVARDNDLEILRLGLAVGRRVGNAVVRNRAKRLLREAFRRQKGIWVVGRDLILVAKPAIADKAQADVDRELEKRLRQLATRRGTKPAGPAPSSGN